MTFDYWTAIATSQQIKGCDPVPEMLAAMQALAVERSKQRSEALAAERAAERERLFGREPPLCDPPLTPKQVAAWHAMAPGQVLYLHPGQELICGRATKPVDAKRAAALDALALLDADEICPDRVATATARVAAAREAAPEPVSVGSWGMH